MAIIIGTSGNNTISGTVGTDIITGLGGNDTINGGAGSDIIDGGAGNDTIGGGAGNDIIFGGAGDDTITGGAGNDILTGGSGSDLFVYGTSFGNDAILDFKVGVDHLKFIGVSSSSISLTQNIFGTVVKVGTNTITLLGVRNVQLSDLLQQTTQHPPTINNQSFSIAENNAAGQAVGVVSASDQDGGALAYSIVGGSPYFTIDATTGILKATSSLNYEAGSSYSLQIKVTDNTGLSTQAQITVNVTNVNEAPTNISLSNNSVNENSANGTVVGNLLVTDPDAGDTATYTLLDNAGGRFAISGNQLVVSGALNFETNTSHSITVKVTDSGGLTYNKTFTINVNNVNEAPSDISLSNNSVNENSANGTVVANLSSTDPDAGDTATYTLLDNAGGRFAISGNQLIVSGALDYETSTSHSITVKVTDSGGLSYNKTFTINVNDVAENHAPTDINLSNNSVNENVANGTLVGALSATDPDVGDLISFTLLDNAGGKFSLNASNQIVTAGALDYEAQNSYNITVRATDSTGGTFDKILTININNVNEAPTDLTLSNATVTTLGPSTIGTLSLVDPDAGDTAAFSLLNDLGGQFAISGNQLATTGTPVNGVYQLTVTGTDSGGLTFSKQFNIIINHPTAPTDITLSGTAVNENSAIGTVVGNLGTLDSDPGDTSTFTLISNPNGAFAISGNQLVVVGALDFETQNAYNITVRATDSYGLILDKNFTININNVNEAPTDITLSNNSVNENSANGTLVGNLSALDPDAGDTATFSLLDSAGGRFAISGNQLVVNGPLDYETIPAHTIIVQVTDSGGLTYNKTFTINVNDVPENHAPTDISLSNNFVSENVANGTLVGLLSATDPDAGDFISFSLLNDAGGKFSINAFNQLITTGALDYETQNSYNITVRATDLSGATFDKILTININNVNEAPTNLTLSNSIVTTLGPSTVGTLTLIDPDIGDTSTFSLLNSLGGQFAISGNQLVTTGTPANGVYQVTVIGTDSGGLTFSKLFNIVINHPVPPSDITLSGNSVNENSANGTVVGNLGTFDSDPGDTSTFTLLTNPGGKFALSGNQLVVGGALDFETQSTYNITIRATDSFGLTFDKNFTINVNNVNEAPTDMTLSNSSVNENVANGTLVGTIAVFDPDAGETFTYSLLDSAGGKFSLNASHQIVTSGALNYETQNSYNITVRATDHGGLFIDKTFTINVNNVNEAPTDITLSNSTVFNNIAVGSTIGNLASIDPDIGDTATFSINAGPVSNYFAIVGNQLVTAAGLDGNNPPNGGGITVPPGGTFPTSFNISIHVVDSGGLSFNKAFTITTTEPPPPPPNLFTIGNDTVDFNTILASSYSGSPYSALAGNDIVTLPDIANAAAAGFVIGTLFSGGLGTDTITSGNGSDLISGGAGADTFNMKVGGADTITDFLPGTDILKLAAGSPSLGPTDFSYVHNVTSNTTANTTTFNFDETGTNFLTVSTALSGTWTNITLNGLAVNVSSTTFQAAQNNILLLGTGNDNFVINNAAGHNTINANDGADVVAFSGALTGSTILHMGTGDDTTYDGQHFLTTLSGSLSIYGDAGNDDLTLIWEFNSAVPAQTTLGDVYIDGGAGNDRIVGTDAPASHHIYGGEGDDIIEMAGGTFATAPFTQGTNVADGGPGNDILGDSSATDDTFIGGSGNDRMLFAASSIFGQNSWEGGAGNDYFDFTDPTGRNMGGSHPDKQTVVYNATWDGSHLISNEGTDFIKSFINNFDHFQLNVTNTSGISVTAADILSHLTMSLTSINTDTSPLVPAEFHSQAPGPYSISSFNHTSYNSGGSTIITSNASTPDTLIQFDNTAIYVLDNNLTATPLSTLVDVHFV